jgi:pellino protein
MLRRGNPCSLACNYFALSSSLQVGRSSESPIDFVVMDTVPGDKIAESKMLRSTISRFACRILCDRLNPRVVKVHAAGFDSSRNIFLGVSASSTC